MIGLCLVLQASALEWEIIQAFAGCRKMVESPDSRVDFAFAEALAFGTLALQRGFRPPADAAGAPSLPLADHPQACSSQ